jgi:hypothetical protein
VTVTGTTGIGFYQRVTWYDDLLSAVSTDLSYTFAMPEADVNLSAGLPESPRLLVHSWQIPADGGGGLRHADRLGLATDTDSDGYLEYGSDEYKKVTARLIQAPATSPLRATSPSLRGRPYYFKVEPIEWRVLSGKGSERPAS